MTTRTKLHLAVYAYCIMTFLNVFSKPLHISDALQWVLILGSFIPLGFAIYFLRRQKLEAKARAANIINLQGLNFLNPLLLLPSHF